MPKGTWQTTSGPGVALVAVGVVAALAYVALRSFAAMLGDAVAVALTAVIAAAAGAGAHWLAVRVRGRRRVKVAAAAEKLAVASARMRREQLEALPAALQASVPPQAIENHHHGPEFHIYGAGGQDAAAALIRKALSGHAGDAATEGKRP